MASLKDSSKRITDERINRPGTHSPDFYQLQNILSQEQASSTPHPPQRLAPGQAMVHKSTFKDGNGQSGNMNALLEACRHGTVSDVRHLIDQGTDVNSKDVHGRTCILLCSTSLIEPIEKIDFLRSKGGNIQDIDDENNGILHLACDLGTLETVQYLVNIGLDINTKGFRSRSCIMACSQSKIQATDKIELLRKMGGNIHDTDVKDDGMLHLACKWGTLDTVRYLINQGLDINTKGKCGRTCILFCSASGTQAIEKIELLISKGGNIYDTDDDNHGMLHLACTWGTLETVRYLINQGLDINTKGRYGRTCILLCGQSHIHAIEKIELLISKGGNIYDIDINNCGILHLACHSGTLDTVNYLINQGLDINTKEVCGRTCILLCNKSHTQAIEKIELLKSKGGYIYDTDNQNNGMLHFACVDGTLDTVKYLIDLGLDINTKDYNGRTCILLCSGSEIQAVEKIEFLRLKGGNISDIDINNDGILHLACRWGTFDTVRYLINQGLDINTKERYGDTCLLLCSQSHTQTIEKIELLISKGGNIYDIDDDNHDMLHLACMLGTLETVRYMIDLGLDVKAKCKSGRTPILHSCTSETQSIEKIKLLKLKGGNIYDTDDDNNGMLHLTCASGTLNTVKHLIDLMLDINAKGLTGRTCILQCTESNKQAIAKIELLRSNGGNVNDRDDQNNGMLHLACVDGTLDTVKHLLDLGLDLNTKGLKGNTCILLCSISNKQAIEKIEFLRSKGGNVNDTDDDNNGMLHAACADGTLDTVKYLIDLGLDINTKGFNGRTCLLTCSQSEIQAIEKIDFLRSKGANINDRDDENSGILNLACACGTLDTVKHLIGLGLDINTKGLTGRTCILHCSESEIQAIEKIDFLMSRGGNINDRYDNNGGILHLACELGTLDTVQYLVNLGLDINSKDGSGKTPVSLGFWSDIQSRQKVDYLISKGAKLSWFMSSIYRIRRVLTS